MCRHCWCVLLMVVALCFRVGDLSGQSPQNDSVPSYVLQWGGKGSGNGQFDRPLDVAYLYLNRDQVGIVYVVDSGNHRIQKFDADGKFLAKWGSKGSGDGQFNLPTGIEVDFLLERVYVVDSGNHRIQKFDIDGNFLAKWGSEGSGDGQFNSPTDLAIEDLTVYVADSGNHRIQKFDTDGAFLAKWGSKGSGDGQFDSPYAVMTLSENVYVTDTLNHRIQRFTAAGRFVSTWGHSGSGNSQFSNPKGLAVDTSRNVIVADTHNCRIQKFDVDGNFLAKWGSKGSGDGQFNLPTGLTIEQSSLYVADGDNHRIQKFSYVVEQQQQPGYMAQFLLGALAVIATGITVFAAGRVAATGISSSLIRGILGALVGGVIELARVFVAMGITQAFVTGQPSDTTVWLANLRFFNIPLLIGIGFLAASGGAQTPAQPPPESPAKQDASK